MQLSTNTLGEIVELLKPITQSEQDRQGLLLQALEGEPILDQIIYSGSNATFILNMAGRVAAYGTTRSGEQAIVAVLKAARTRIGEDQKDRMDLVIKNLDPTWNPSQSGPGQNATAQDDKLIILVLASNPRDTTALRLTEEVDAIRAQLFDTDFGDQFKLEHERAVGPSELRRALLKRKPRIVHFSGHGEAGAIALENKQGKSHLVPGETLARLFRVLRDSVRCVVLNACWSAEQADAIAKEIDCVVGMTKPIGDRAAIDFSSGFYQALGFGRSVRDAFDWGCSAIDLDNIPEEDTPKLITKPGVNAADIKFV